MSRSWKVRSNRAGTLLIEALLTISILSVGLTVIIRSLVSSLRATAYSADYSTAVILLENVISDLRQEESLQGSLNTEGSFPEPYQKFRYRLEAKKAASENVPESLNEIKLTTLWPAGRKESSVSLTTYLFKPSP